MFKILVVEDDKELRRLFCQILTRSGYSALGAEGADAALALLEHEFVDLIITDVMMPGMDGFSFVKLLREGGSNLPILCITAKDRFEDKQEGFLAGADDYMVKPVDVKEMVLRVGALLRRAKSVSERRLVFGETVLEYDTFAISRGGRSQTLPQKEFLLLYKLASFPGRIFTRQQIMDDIWGLDSETDTHTVDVHINRLRDRLKQDSDLEIQTVRGLGYKLLPKQPDTDKA